MRLPQPTVRLRLTLLYGGLSLATGLLLLARTYGLLAQTYRDGRGDGDRRGGHGTSQNRDDGGGKGGPGAGNDQQTVEQQVESARQEERDAALRQVVIQGEIALIVASAVALILGWLAAGRVLRPVRAITAHARHASEATLGERIGLRGPPDELKELADTIDAMLARLEAAFAAQRRFSAEVLTTTSGFNSSCLGS